MLTMAGGNVDIDLYAGVDELDHELNQTGGDISFSGGVDLYEDVLATPGARTADTEFEGDPAELSTAPSTYDYKSFTTIHPKSAQAQAAASQIPERPKGKPLYVGNFTWWTTDRHLEDALQECGITDIVNIKFFENRANGQSKGYALVELGSDVSVRLVTEKLPLKEINGQTPGVTPATKNHLHQFEAQARKINPSLTSHQNENDVGGGHPGPSHGRGFHSRGGFGHRGRGGIRPGMGRGGDFGPEMPMGNPWMGPAGPMHRPPPPGMPAFMDRGMPLTGLPGDKLPPGMMMPGAMGMHPGMAMMMPLPGEPRRPVEWDLQPGFPKSQVAPHFNPAFFPAEGPPPEGLMAGMLPPGPRFESDFMGRPMPPDMYGQFPRPGDDFNEFTRQNQLLTSNSIKKAMVESNSGQHEIAIETLVQAISIIKQSPVAQDETSQILVQSLQDCLQGIEQQMLSSSGVPLTPARKSSKRDSRRYSDEELDGDRRRRKRRSRSRSRSPRGRRSRSRDRHSRSRSRSRERHRRR